MTLHAFATGNINFDFKVMDKCETRLVRLHGKLNIKVSEDMTLHAFSTGNIKLDFKVMDKSVFTMYD